MLAGDGGEEDRLHTQSFLLSPSVPSFPSLSASLGRHNREKAVSGPSFLLATPQRIHLSAFLHRAKIYNLSGQTGYTSNCDLMSLLVCGWFQMQFMLVFRLCFLCFLFCVTPKLFFLVESGREAKKSLYICFSYVFRVFLVLCYT